MRIGSLAERSGTSVLTARRNANGYRESLLALGFSLEETRPFVECLRAGNETGDVCPNSVAVYRRKLAELDQCIAKLSGVRTQVEAQLADAIERARTIGEGTTCSIR